MLLIAILKLSLYPMLNELSTTIATDLSPCIFTWEREKTAGFENTIASRIKIKALRKSRIESFNFDLFVISPWEARRKRTAEKLFLIPLFLDIRCMRAGSIIALIPIKKNGFKKEKFNFSPIYLKFE
jgi:hypothetical protein